MDDVIVKSNIPDYASNGNSIKVVVTYFKGIENKTILDDLAVINIKKIRNSEFFNEVFLEATKEKLEEIAKLIWVQNIELIPAPVESDNVPGRSSHKANVLNSTLSGFGYGLTGKDIKIGVWDGNLENHKDFTGRVVNREYERNTSHGVHVAGTIGGAGLLDPKAKGMAPEVQIIWLEFQCTIK